MGQRIEAMEAGNKEEIVAHGSRNSQNHYTAVQQGNDGIQDFSIDDLYGLFQGDESANVGLGFDGENLSFEATGMPQEIVPSLAGGTMISNKNGESKDDSSSVIGDYVAENASDTKPTAKNKGKRRRQSIKIDIEKGLLPPSWHSEAADRQHRQSMVVEIARLLQSRKKNEPTSEWIRQLPHKARKLEERLYRTAPSLEAYLDRTTLKNRLRRVATVITRQYRDAKVRQRLSQRSSVSSNATFTSIGSSLPSQRDSVTSVQSLDSLRSLRESFSQKSSMPNPVNSSQTGLAAAVNQASSVASSEGSSTFRLPANSGSSHLPNNSFVRMSGDGGTDLIQTATSQGILELEQQKAVNEKLQKQIMENIRRQEELVLRLQARSRGGSEQKGVQAGQGLNNPYQAMQQLSTGSLDVSEQNLSLNQLSASVPQQNNVLKMNLAAQAQLNPSLMAQAALLNQNQGLMPLVQNQLQLGNSLNAANFMMANANLLQQSLRLPSQHSGLTAQQVHLLSKNGTAATNRNNPSIISSLKQQQQEHVSTPVGGSNAAQRPASSSSGSNPSMPPPHRLSQRRRPSSELDSYEDSMQDNSKDASPLSPGSFSW